MFFSSSHSFSGYLSLSSCFGMTFCLSLWHLVCLHTTFDYPYVCLSLIGIVFLCSLQFKPIFAPFLSTPLIFHVFLFHSSSSTIYHFAIVNHALHSPPYFQIPQRMFLPPFTSTFLLFLPPFFLSSISSFSSSSPLFLFLSLFLLLLLSIVLPPCSFTPEKIFSVGILQKMMTNVVINDR